MSVIKTGKRQSRFTTIDSEPINNHSLSFAARGLLVYIMSKPENWKIRVSDLMKAQKPGAAPGTPCGKQMIQSILKELQAAGHARLVTARDENGKVRGKEWEFREEPILTDEAVTRQSVEPTDGLLDNRLTPSISNERLDSNKRVNTNKISTLTQREKIGNSELSQTTETAKILSSITPPVAPAPPVPVNLEEQILQEIQKKTCANESRKELWRMQARPVLSEEEMHKHIRAYARGWMEKHGIGKSDEELLTLVKSTSASGIQSYFERAWLPNINRRTGAIRTNKPEPKKYRWV